MIALSLGNTLLIAVVGGLLFGSFLRLIELAFEHHKEHREKKEREHE